MIKEIFKNYDAFYNMVLSATIMSNVKTAELEQDAGRIIDFIGNAYTLDLTLINNIKTIVFDELTVLNLSSDQQALYRNRDFSIQYSDTDSLYDIKADVLEKLQRLSNTEDNNVNPSWFDYSHYITYQPDIRFAKINLASASGNLIMTRQAGILKMLGIGCEVNEKEAIKRLLQCVYWGDIPSMYLLAYSYSLIGEAEQAKIFYELAALSKNYLNAGYTVLPEEAKKRYSEDARIYYIYISTIKQDIIYAYNKKLIDFSFIEAITSDTLDYFAIMDYINNYDRKDWKNITNSSEKPTKKLGFR